jgi:hypothetical protein
MSPLRKKKNNNDEPLNQPMENDGRSIHQHPLRQPQLAYAQNPFRIIAHRI